MSISRRDAASTADFLELPGSSSHGSSGPGASDALQGETESTIARIWEDLLGVSDIGADDDFFDLGGHSLIAFRLANRIEKQLGTKIKLPSLLEARTLRQIAVMIGGGGRDLRSHRWLRSAHLEIFRLFSFRTPSEAKSWRSPLNGPHRRDLGWGLAQSVTGVDVPGSHSGLMTQPDVLDLARALRQSLAEPTTES